MRKLYITTLALLLVAVASIAGPISQEAAQRKAAEFMTSQGMEGSNPLLVHRAPSKARSGVVCSPYYVFNSSKKGGGFVVISGDDRAEEVLGYSPNGSFPEGEMPSNMKAWLDGYARQIAALEDESVFVVENGITQQVPMGSDFLAAILSTSYNNEERPAISPMLTTEWDQDGPYWSQCPTWRNPQTGDVDTCYTGCGATALAQVMYYHRWPAGPTNIIGGYRSEMDYDGGTVSVTLQNLPSVTFQWDEMPAISGYPGESNPAVAQLMRYVSQAMDTQYGNDLTGGSGTGIISPMTALEDLSYDPNYRYMDRCYYSVDEWHSTIYNELKEGRPVYYMGQSTGGGHAFVCDGYDGEGLYHFNWGWSGYGDGFFRLEALNPYYSGIGGSSSQGGFSFSQAIIAGIQPPTGNPAESKYLSGDSLYVQGMNFGSKLFSINPKRTTFDAGVATLDKDNKIEKVIILAENTALMSGYGLRATYSGNNVKQQLGLTTGTHRVVFVSRETGFTEWKSAQASFEYISLVVNEYNMLTSVVKEPSIDLTVESFAIDQPEVVMNKPASIKAVIKNNSHLDFNGELLLTLHYNGQKIDWETEGLFISPNATDSVIFNTYFNFIGSQTLSITAQSNYQEKTIGFAKIDVKMTAAIDGILCDPSSDANADGYNTSDAPYYTLSGTRIDNPTKPGIYIRNKKKIVVR